MSLSIASKAALTDRFRILVGNHHWLVHRMDTDPSYSDIAGVYPDRRTALGLSAADILHDLGGMAGEW